MVLRKIIESPSKMSTSDQAKMAVASYSEAYGGQEYIPATKNMAQSIALDEYVLKIYLEVFQLEK